MRERVQKIRMNNACEELESIQSVFQFYAQCFAGKRGKAKRFFVNVREIVGCNVVFCFLDPFVLEVEEYVLHGL